MSMYVCGGLLEGQPGCVVGADNCTCRTGPLIQAQSLWKELKCEEEPGGFALWLTGEVTTALQICRICGAHRGEPCDAGLHG